MVENGYTYKQNLNQFFKIDSIKTDHLLNEYLDYGGYPKVILTKTRKKKQVVMAEIYQSYLEKDIAYLLNISNTEGITNLVRVLASQAGSLVNISELSSTLNLSVNTVKNYLWYLEKTYIVKKLTPFFKKVRKEITKTPIYYFNDLGLKNYAQRQFGLSNLVQTNGHLFENFVFLQLQEKLPFSSSIHYWRTQDKAEVDFVINTGTTLIPIEVKYTKLTTPKTTKSFISFISKYSPKNAYIVHLGKPMKKMIHKTQVNFIPYHNLSKTKILNQ